MSLESVKDTHLARQAHSAVCDLHARLARKEHDTYEDELDWKAENEDLEFRRATGCRFSKTSLIDKDTLELTPSPTKADTPSFTRRK